jgi:hypothetical protein
MRDIVEYVVQSASFVAIVGLLLGLFVIVVRAVR